MSEWELTDGEIEAIPTPSMDVMLTESLWWDKEVGKVAQRKLVEWLDKKMGFAEIIDDLVFNKNDRLFSCMLYVEDWQALRRGVGLEAKDDE